MEVNFRCVPSTAINRFVNFEIDKAIEEEKTPKHIFDLTDVIVDDEVTDVFIISNAQNSVGLRNFIIECEMFEKSVVVIFDDADKNNFEKNIISAIPLCDTIIKETSKNTLPKIVLCTGPMRGGKSQEVLRLIDQCKVLKLNILCLTPKLDDRSGAKIKSRNGCEVPSVILGKLTEIDEKSYLASEVIVIDEAQFFPDLYLFIKKCKDDNKTVFISGLDGDLNRQPFGQVLNCIPLCDKVTKFNALCMIKNDGTPAIFSMFIDDPALLKDGNTHVGDGAYFSVSRKAYNDHQKKQ